MKLRVEIGEMQRQTNKQTKHRVHKESMEQRVLGKVYHA